jgi:hypothetical protein
MTATLADVSSGAASLPDGFRKSAHLQLARMIEK